MNNNVYWTSSTDTESDTSGNPSFIDWLKQTNDRFITEKAPGAQSVNEKKKDPHKAYDYASHEKFIRE